MFYLAPALFAFCLTLLLGFCALRFFPQWGLVDRPHRYGLTRAPIPYYGGLVIFLAFVVSTVLFVELHVTVLWFLAGATLIMLVSFLDDLFNVSPWIRLGVQVVAGLMLVFGGIGIQSLSNPLGDPLLLNQWMVSIDGIYTVAVWSALFTVIWVVALVNTMNFLDGLNGLPSGVAAIAGLALFFLSIRPGLHFDMSLQVPVATMSIILCATAFGFWLFDFHPAKMLMGDTGSMFLGFVIATLAIFSGGKVATAFLVMGFPLLDAGWVIVRRILHGKAPWKGDLKHLHHRLLEVGLRERQALFLIYVVSILFGGIAVLLEGINKLYALGALFILMVIVGMLAVRMAGKKRG